MPTDLDHIARQLKESERAREKATALALEGVANSKRFLAVIKLQHSALGELQDAMEATVKSNEALIKGQLVAEDGPPEAATQ